jgi:hypothetical protein
MRGGNGRRNGELKFFFSGEQEKREKVFAIDIFNPQGKMAMSWSNHRGLIHLTHTHILRLSDSRSPTLDNFSVSLINYCGENTAFNHSTQKASEKVK